MSFGNHALVEEDLVFANFLLNQSVDPGFCLGANGQFLYVNSSMCLLTGYSRDELLSMRLPDIDVDFSLQDWSEKWLYIADKKSSYLTFKSCYRTKKNTISVVKIAMTYVEYKGEGIACVFAKAVESVMDEALSIVCHELRTPLNIISFSNSLLKRHIDEWTEDKITSCLNHIQIAIEQISQTLDNTLLLAKTGAAKLEFQTERLDLPQFCHNLIQSHHHPIHLTSSGNCLVAWMDKKSLELILNNLLNNAVKYSPPDSPVFLHLVCEYGKVIFHVQDTGVGIPLVDQSRLFEPFYRGSNINHIPGTGLGLSIVKTLVDLHSGKITVESEVGVGTKFTVILPTIKLNGVAPSCNN
jgi:PAS domain S-box-containing protein